MISVRMVQAAADEVIDVIGMRNGFVPATGPVNVAALAVAALLLRGALYGVARVGLEAVLVHVIAVNVVHVAFVQIIGVAVVLHCGVAAIAAVGVAVSGVGITGHAAHHPAGSARRLCVFGLPSGRRAAPCEIARLNGETGIRTRRAFRVLSRDS